MWLSASSAGAAAFGGFPPPISASSSPFLQPHPSPMSFHVHGASGGGPLYVLGPLPPPPPPQPTLSGWGSSSYPPPPPSFFSSRPSFVPFQYSPHPPLPPLHAAAPPPPPSPYTSAGSASPYGAPPPLPPLHSPPPSARYPTSPPLASSAQSFGAASYSRRSSAPLPSPAVASASQPQSAAVSASAPRATASSAPLAIGGSPSSSSGSGSGFPVDVRVRACRHRCGCRRMSQSLSLARVAAHERNGRVHKKCGPGKPCFDLLRPQPAQQPLQSPAAGEAAAAAASQEPATRASRPSMASAPLPPAVIASRGSSAPALLSSAGPVWPSSAQSSSGCRHVCPCRVPSSRRFAREELHAHESAHSLHPLCSRAACLMHAALLAAPAASKNAASAERTRSREDREDSERTAKRRRDKEAEVQQRLHHRDAPTAPPESEGSDGAADEDATAREGGHNDRERCAAAASIPFNAALSAEAALSCPSPSVGPLPSASATVGLFPSAADGSDALLWRASSVPAM